MYNLCLDYIYKKNYDLGLFVPMEVSEEEYLLGCILHCETLPSYIVEGIQKD